LEKFSPHKQWVYDAIKYAEKKDVLIVHAAGNDAKDIDSNENFLTILMIKKQNMQTI
jgi:hypothetical protein